MDIKDMDTTIKIIMATKALLIMLKSLIIPFILTFVLYQLLIKAAQKRTKQNN